jgi:CHASE2 domain-containing sensor protein
MSKLVILKSTGGDFSRGFVFTMSIATENGLTDSEEIGNLPPDVQLEKCYEDWKTAYSELGVTTRLFPSGKAVRKASPLQDCQRMADALATRFNQWLRSASFLSVRDLFLTEVGRDEPVRFVIQVDCLVLQQLPWALWEMFDRYQKAEISIATPTFQRRDSNGKYQSIAKVRILAILGDSQGIDVKRDRELLTALPNADVTFLVEPQRQALADQLWEQSWDILFFAGHSETQQEKGYLYINPTDRLSIADLKYALKRSVDRGLSLGIFNSCDGFGLARELADLQIPQTIFMREPVPDRVAQTFLKYFLDSFSQGELLYLSVRNARERLRTLETSGELNPAPDSAIDSAQTHELGVFPCASWLPLIFQNLAESPPTWAILQQPTHKVPVSPVVKAMRQWSIAGAIALSVGASVCGVRSQGWLQALELKAYDHVMQMRSVFRADTVDERLLVVTIDDTDAEIYKGPKSDLSLTNSNLVALLKKLQQSNAKVIGLDLIRDSKGVDPKIVRSLQKMNNVVGICINRLPNSPGVKPPQGLEQNVGFTDMAQDSTDASIRRHLLALPIDRESPCQSNDSFALSLAAQYLGIQPDELLNRLTIMNGTDRPGAYYKTADRDALIPGEFPHVMINYRYAKIPSMTMSDFLQERGGKLDLSQRIVVIGNTRPESTDLHPIPLTKPLSHATAKEVEGRTAGVWIQAEKAGYLVNLLQRERSAIWIPEERLAIGMILLAAIGGTVIIRLVNNYKLHILLINGILILVYAGTVVVFTQFTAWVPLVPLLIATIASAGITSAVNTLSSDRQ